MGLRTKQDWEKRLSEFFPRLKPKIGIGLEKSARINLEDLEICKDFCVPIIVGEKEKEIKKDYETISTSVLTN